MTTISKEVPPALIPKLAAELLKNAYGTAISVPIYVLADAVFWNAFNARPSYEEFEELIRLNLIHYVQLLDSDAVDVEDLAEADYLNQMLDTASNMQIMENDPDDQVPGFIKVIRKMRRSKDRIL